MTVTTRERRNPLNLRAVEPVAAVAENRGGAKLPYTQIRTDGGTQMRAGLNEATVAEYADELRRGAVFPPVLVFFDGQTYWLGDGFHRVRAYFLAYGDQVGVPCEVRPGTRRDAVLCAAGANAVHGLRRTNADKRRAVETLLRDDEWGQWSNREIARRCHVDEKTVRSLREVHTAENPQYGQPGMGADSAENPQYERIFIHPKTGQPAKMNVTGQRQATQPRSRLAVYAQVAEEMHGQIDESSDEADAKGHAEPVVRPKPHSNGASPVLTGGLPVNGAQHGAVRRAELLALYRQVVSTLGEYGALTGMHTHTPAVRRALEPLIEELRKP
ncbi:MAG: hypothetical protein KJZ93_21800 [Caldilineaceae bacterium]|nr:hypothetical protein [Caldilineaceae bacterium]